MLNMASADHVVVVMVPFPEYGHLTAHLRLSRLISTYDIPVYFATTAARNRQLKLRLLDWNLDQFPNIHLYDLSPPSLNKTAEESAEEANDAAELYASSQLLAEPLSALCRELSTTCKRLVIIHDTFMLESTSVAIHELTSTPVETYMFHGFPALTLYSWIQQGVSPDLDDDLLLLPLKPHMPPVDSLAPLSKFKVFIKGLTDCAAMSSAGQIINTCRDMEAPYLDALAKLSGKPVWGVGPLNPLRVPQDKVRHKYIEWLDKQPKCSVIFVSFGTVTDLSPQQINELATGLERCEHKFIWVLRSKDKMGKIFTSESAPENELPTGFEERVADRGIIARDWVPQLEILAHPSTGGYLFHSGGGSFFESIAMGVPMATWPMHSDNPFNDMLITKVLKVGIPITDWRHKGELVTSDKIANALKTLMNSPDGEEIRQRCTELSKAINMSLSTGGTTHKQMESFIAHITRKSEDEENPN